ncbi:hypothetical protein [Sphingobium sp. YR768]|uniref:hypothetical protein n=1 Tax=Sphingobium sp. YR768 TaxID=1884365 RepID=UPI0008C493D9|nr:hypothetical protein [Sphingobium sp. YR768]SER43735.1 hypothetical protein SAMN05518866_11126 [Sphingobium sp. YR768]
MSGYSYNSDHALLLLGRLDGRLQSSPVADIWLARARLRGAATLANAAGVPIEVRDLQNWIAGRTAPPRHSEGLNDPLSVAALFHFALSAAEDGQDSLSRATLNLSRDLLDDREEATLWAQEDLVRFGPLWRVAQEVLGASYAAPSLLTIAERLAQVRQSVTVSPVEGPLMTTSDGRQWRIASARPDMAWLAACHMPLALQRSGLALRLLPSFTDMPRLPPEDVEEFAAVLQDRILKCAREGLADLNRLEAQMDRLPTDLNVTRRSKLPLLIRLELAYPGLSRIAVSRLLGVSHQGATKLVEQFRAFSKP